MKQVLLSLVFVLGLATVSYAQSATPSNRLAWDQSDATVAVAEAYTFKQYADGSPTGTVITGVTCTAGAVVSCSAPFGAFTPGTHTIQLTATNAAGESVKSAVFNFTFVVVPTAPGNLRVQ